MELTINEKCEKLAVGIEKKHGPEILLKLGLATINKILVEKGITTKDELCTKFMKEVQKFIEDKKDEEVKF